MLPHRSFVFKPIERPYVPLKSSTKNFESSHLFRWACFHVTITGDFEGFQHLIFEASFLKN